MVKIQQTQDGSYFVIIRKSLVEERGWKKGDDIAYFALGGAILPQQGDLIMRKANS